eukprot:9546526-Ditylum_brightwellii.AAC.1
MWFSELYQRLQMRTYVKAISKGLAVVKKTVPVGCKVVIVMNKHFIKCDTIDGYENRAVLTALRQAVRHGGKVGLTIWQNCYWNHYTEHRKMEWPEEKTESTNVMTFSRDKDDLEFDMFHSMACYLLNQEGKYTSGAADKVSTAIEACDGKVEE